MSQFDLDNFAGSSGTNLTAHTPNTGGSWAKVTSYTDDIKIDGAGNATTINGGGNGAFYSIAGVPATADYFVQCAFTRLTAGVGYPGVLGRIQAAANTFYWFLWDDTTSQFAIFKHVAGTQTSLVIAAGSWANGATHTLKLAMTGTTINGYVDGALTCTVTDASISGAGTAGLELYNVVNGTACFQANTGFEAQDTSSTIITADDANLSYTGKWSGVVGTGASSRNYSLTSGAYLDAALSGTATCEISFDMSNCSAGQYPDVAYCLDGEWYRQTLDATGAITCTFPTWTGEQTSSWLAHRLTFIYEGVDDGADTAINAWGALVGVAQFKSITCDYGCVTLPIGYIRQQIEFAGDSITETARELYLSGGTYSATWKAAHIGWPKLTADLLGFGCVQAGYSGNGLIKTSSGTTTTTAGVPLLRTAWPLVASGVTYGRRIAPTAIVVSIGTNDHAQSVPVSGAVGTGFQATYEAFLQDIRTALPNSLIVCLCLPSMVGSGINYNTAISAAITATGDSNTYFHDYSSGLFVEGDFSDGIHFNVQGAARMAAKLSVDVGADLSTAGVAMQKATGDATVIRRAAPHRGR